MITKVIKIAFPSNEMIIEPGGDDIEKAVIATEREILESLTGEKDVLVLKRIL